RAQAVEERRDLTQVSDRRGGRLVLRGSGVGEEEDQLGPARSPEADPIAVRERPLRHRLVVDERAVARLLVADEEPRPGRDDLGVVARDLAAGEPEIVGFAPPDPERILPDRHDPAAERIGDFQSGVRHRSSESVSKWPRNTRSTKTSRS